MLTSALCQSPERPPVSFTSRWLPRVLLVLLLGVAAGCDKGGSSSANAVSGKVSLGDKPVSGLVVFVYADGKELSAPIGPDGTYTIDNPLPGQVKVSIKAMPGAMATGAPKVAGTPEMPKDGPAMATATGVPPPAKYQSATTSGLTYEVKAGKQTYDIPLK